MSKQTLYFAVIGDSAYCPSFLGLGFPNLAAAQEYADIYYRLDPSPVNAILSAAATAFQVAAIRRAEAEGREYDVDFVRPASPEASARVRVRTFPYVPPESEPLGTIYHLPDGGRVLRHPDGRLENLAPLGEYPEVGGA